MTCGLTDHQVTRFKHQLHPKVFTRFTDWNGSSLGADAELLVDHPPERGHGVLDRVLPDLLASPPALLSAEERDRETAVANRRVRRRRNHLDRLVVSGR